MILRSLGAFAVATTLILPAVAQTSDSGTKSSMKNAGSDTKSATKEAGRGVAQGTKTGYHKTTHGTKKVLHKVEGKPDTPVNNPPAH